MKVHVASSRRKSLGIIVLKPELHLCWGRGLQSVSEESTLPWSSDGRRLLPAPFSLLRKAAAWAKLLSRFCTQALLREPETESSYPLWMSSVPPRCLLSNESVMRLSAGRDGRFSSLWTGGAQKCAPRFSITITRRSWDLPKPRRRAEISTGTPSCEVTRFSLKISCTSSLWNALLVDDTSALPLTHAFTGYLNLQNFTKGCFMLLNSRAINWSIIKLG